MHSISPIGICTQWAKHSADKTTALPAITKRPPTTILPTTFCNTYSPAHTVSYLMHYLLFCPFLLSTSFQHLLNILPVCMLPDWTVDTQEAHRLLHRAGNTIDLQSRPVSICNACTFSTCHSLNSLGVYLTGTRRAYSWCLKNDSALFFL